MFTSARLKLTGWYLLIIMLISLSFSVAIYRVLTNELDRIEQMQEDRMQRRLQLEFQLPPEVRQQLPPPPDYGLAEIEDSKNRIALILALIDVAILILSSGAGFFLAGRTLNPIQEMVDEQNRFVSDASHELRTPLTALKTSIEVSLRDKKMTLSESKQTLKSNLDDVNGLQVLSDNLLLLAAAQNNKKSTSQEKISLVDIIKHAIEKLTVLANEKEITVKTDIDDVELMGNRQEIIRLFIILLDNAIKYSPSHSIVDIIGKKSDSHIQVEINDKGPGISEDDLPYIFDRFYRADKSRSQTNGYGLGLAIAKKIALDHHGSILVKSKIDKGTTFITTLPIKR